MIDSIGLARLSSNLLFFQTAALWFYKSKFTRVIFNISYGNIHFQSENSMGKMILLIETKLSILEILEFYNISSQIQVSINIKYCNINYYFIKKILIYSDFFYNILCINYVFIHYTDNSHENFHRKHSISIVN